MSNKALFVGGCTAPWHRIALSAPHIEKALLDLGYAPEVTGIFQVGSGDEHTGDYSAINAEKLSQQAVVVLHTTGEAQGADVDALVSWVDAGGALVGLHCAADSFKDNAAWIEMIGGAFRHHPQQLDVAVEVVDKSHPITQGVSDFTVFEELYLFSDYHPEKVHLLARSRSYDHGDGNPVPIAWVKEIGKGRVFYLSLGHREDVMTSEPFQMLFKNGVKWVTRQS